MSLIISLCDYTGNMLKPWAQAGHTCIAVDIQHSIRKDRIEDNIRYVWGDVRSWCPPERPSMVFAFPPCTHLAVSGARDFQTKGGPMLADALYLFDACVMAGEYAGCPYMVENPVSRLSSHRRKPDYTFDPCDYGDPYTKKTCLWTGGGFVMPPKDRVEPTEGSKMHLVPPSSDRENIRSATPMGFAQAVFEANNTKV